MLKKTIFFSTLLLCHSSIFAASAADKISYALGYEVASQSPDEVIIEPFIQGIRDQKAHKANIYTEEELQAAYHEFQKTLTVKQTQEAAKNFAQEVKFLKDNAKKSGVITTASGLQYKIHHMGNGKQPNPASIVTTHYKGQLLDGTVFDSSYERGEAIEFPLNQVITGWTEGLQLLKVGSKATLYIPAKLAYGQDGVQGTIPPNSTLIFDIELINVK
ncbi:peptidylprolyl isomerase [Acinetobacter defluvii]|uniref:FKBP-type peptidyl-prolyl cis-trans isomerase n=1 Tax=Acinetobacter defluvii TaxID=1871111 RepID=UPI00149074AC|nr:FKBP-type peptidyl-prolyl cis-trans isomerase [Acinetobacter defluvii]NNP74019.1 peptidylprolyl isomerase [Acinetobacter defluvii]